MKEWTNAMTTASALTFQNTRGHICAIISMRLTLSETTFNRGIGEMNNIRQRLHWCDLRFLFGMGIFYTLLTIEWWIIKTNEYTYLKIFIQSIRYCISPNENVRINIIGNNTYWCRTYPLVSDSSQRLFHFLWIWDQIKYFNWFIRSNRYNSNASFATLTSPFISSRYCPYRARIGQPVHTWL